LTLYKTQSVSPSKNPLKKNENANKVYENRRKFDEERSEQFSDKLPMILG